MTDNGLAALAERLKPYQMPDPWTDDLRIVVMVGTAEEVAAAILRNGAVFLPDGLGPVMVGMAKEIAAIEAEAVADERARIAEAMRALEPCCNDAAVTLSDRRILQAMCQCGAYVRDAVLAIINPELTP